MSDIQESGFGRGSPEGSPQGSPIGSPQAATTEQFEFRGDAKTYFGIWIVNLLLSIITIGIYTAWAKVRRLRYFYGNTFLAGNNFEYHAEPKQILIGRIIVVVVLVIYNVLVNLSPIFGLLIIPYLLAFPWLLNKSMAFNARVTSYRNIRFNFEGTYWKALLAFVIMPILAILSLGLLGPIASRLVNNYIGNGLSYGKAGFETDARLKPLYANLGMTVVMMIVATIVTALLGAVAYYTALAIGLFPDYDAAFDLDNEEAIASMAVAGVIGFYIALTVSYIFYSAGVRNIALNSTVLDQKHSFTSSVSRGRYTWIVVTNLFAALLSFGLLIPWAAVRSWRYLMNRSQMNVAGTLDGFIADRHAEGSAAPAEFFDIEGIDFGL